MKLNVPNRLTALSCIALMITGFYLAPPATSEVSASELIVAQAQARSRIAVLDFDLADTSGNSAYSGLFAGTGPARGIGDLLTNRLVQSGRYTVIERTRIDEVLREQNFGQSGRVDASTAAEIGRILGVELVVIGSITRFNTGDGETGGSGCIRVPVIGCVGGRVRNHNVEVELTARLVNTTTAEIVAAAEGSGKARQGGFDASTGMGNISNSAHNPDKMVSDAAEAAVDQLTENLVGRTATGSSVATQPLPTPSAVNALIADVSGSTVVINHGSRNGFRVGMVLSIERIDRVITDPATGQEIRTMTTPIGRIELTEVDATSGVGKILNGTGFKVGDRARAVE